ncbi:uncharacterized protein EKO05_0002764 [Ascochyta rabiei]|uniref:Uncharacterized protein n=1 Tax=Didymella rabiei TaxID=5454 RepID=A0A162YPH2_DIDRA|nr:uncharacterized protein EKO05_0002764 [Ascochyta rabiei]KZM20150.1 hypothetical protein ST47_g8722 [Ascochyta rabiei]UPX12201.1 hypothetical protein EKO05_0002764 [Ascochyta rabiei]
MVSYLAAAVALLSATASARLSRHRSIPCGAKSTISYTLVSGDTLGSLATRFNSGICDIAKLNKITNPNSVPAGAVLTIPQGCTDPDNSSCLAPVSTPTNTCVFGVGSSYNVRGGDTLTSIANDFNITLAGLESANPGVTNPDLIQIGQLLNVTVCPGSSCEWIGTYTIKQGDTFVDLAVKFGTTTGQIESVNANVNPLFLQIGSVIVLPEDCEAGKS